MSRRHDGADARFSFSHGGEGDACGHYAFVEEFAGELHGQLAFADDDRRDWRFAHWRILAADIEAKSAEFLFEIARILPELLHQLWLLLEHIKRGDTGCGHRGRMRSREEERTRAVIQEVDEIPRAADIST